MLEESTGHQIQKMQEIDNMPTSDAVIETATAAAAFVATTFVDTTVGAAPASSPDESPEQVEPMQAPAIEVVDSDESSVATVPVTEETTSEEVACAEAIHQEAVQEAAQDAHQETDEAANQATHQETRNGFLELELLSEVQQAVADAGYSQPTEIQAQIIPHMLAGRDVLAQSQTGTGKTAGFALPVLSRIDIHQRRPQVLVLAPTRELAIQVADSFAKYGRKLDGLSIATIYGGQSYEPQLRQLRSGSQIVVGTPGRVIDHIKRGTLDISQIDCLVLDEGDEMLNMGFLEDVEFVLENAGDQRQIALFSATMPPAIRKISKRYLNDPVQVTVATKTVTADSIRQRAVFVAPRAKHDVLNRFLESEDTDGVIVFAKTRESTLSLAEKLVRSGYRAVALNGDMAQRVRERTIQQLKSNKLDILVATDVAARGLDVSRISHVFNFDVPHDSESYVHRIGRTGRAGRKGEAIIFLTNSQRGKLQMIERTTKQQIEVVEAPTAGDINNRRVAKFKQDITAAVENVDLTVFQKMIATHAKNTGYDMIQIAAALAHLAQGDRDFFMKERPTADTFKPRERGGRRGERGFDRKPRSLGRPERGKTRYRLAVGRRDGVKPGNIVGAIANTADLPGSKIGPIRIHDTYSTVDLPHLSRDAQRALESARIAGRTMELRPADPRDCEPQTEGRRPYGGRGGKSFDGRKPFGKPKAFGKSKSFGKPKYKKPGNRKAK